MSRTQADKPYKLDTASLTRKDMQEICSGSHLMFMQASPVLYMLEHVSPISVFHCNCQILLCQEDLLKLDDVGMQHQAVIQNLSLHIPGNCMFSTL